MDTAKNHDQHAYKGWLNSDSFIKRALATWAYQTIGGLIVAFILLIPVCLLFVLGVSFR